MQLSEQILAAAEKTGVELQRDGNCPAACRQWSVEKVVVRFRVAKKQRISVPAPIERRATSPARRSHCLPDPKNELHIQEAINELVKK